MNKYIVKDRAFNNKEIAIQYCIVNDFDVDIMLNEYVKKEDYFRIVTTQGRGNIDYLYCVTSTEFYSDKIQNHIKELSTGEYNTRLVRIEGITKKEYDNFMLLNSQQK